MEAPVLAASNPYRALLAIVEFRTMMFAGRSTALIETMMPSPELFALTLSLTVMLMASWSISNDVSPVLPLFSIST